MKKYQIRNVDSEGCGSFYYVEVADDSTNTEIEKRIAIFLTEKRENHNRVLFFGWAPLFSNRKMKIVEYNHETNKATRGGHKGWAKLDNTIIYGDNLFTGKKFNKTFTSFIVKMEKRNEKALTKE